MIEPFKARDVKPRCSNSYGSITASRFSPDCRQIQMPYRDYIMQDIHLTQILVMSVSGTGCMIPMCELNTGLVDKCMKYNYKQ